MKEGMRSWASNVNTKPIKIQFDSVNFWNAATEETNTLEQSPS
jgi:hypothetical protein